MISAGTSICRQYSRESKSANDFIHELVNCPIICLDAFRIASFGSVTPNSNIFRSTIRSRISSSSAPSRIASKIAMRRRCEPAIYASSLPPARYITPVWSASSCAPVTPTPASEITNAMSSSSHATNGTCMPPSECPITPTRSGSINSWAIMYRAAASPSCARSCVVSPLALPVEPPTMRSSKRSTAMPRVVR